MTFNQMQREICILMHKLNTKHDYLLYESGIDGIFHLGMQGSHKLLIEGVAPNDILAFIIDHNR